MILKVHEFGAVLQTLPELQLVPVRVLEPALVHEHEPVLGHASASGRALVPLELAHVGKTCGLVDQSSTFDAQPYVVATVDTAVPGTSLCCH